MALDHTMQDPSRSTTGIDPAEICTLAPEGIADRQAWVREAILPHAVDREQSASGLAWEFEDVPGLAAKLGQLVEKERGCCSGIDFVHGRSTATGRLRLEVRGIDPHSPVFASLEPGTGAAPPVVARLAKALGVGAALSLLVCCALPIALAALLGATAAAPFALLDDPFVIGGAALLSGGAAFVWVGRKHRAAAIGVGTDGVCGPGC